MKKLYPYLQVIIVALVLSISQNITAQEVWDLQKCVDYAIENNISVKQSELQESNNALIYQQSKDGRWPSANFSTSLGEQFGRNIDPTTNQFITTNIFSSSMGLQSGVNLFNWFSVKNTIEANKLNLSASQEQTKKLQEDIALNVAAVYLQAILSKEQEKVSKIAVDQTLEQLRLTRLQVEAGTIPELNAAELEAQLARDSATLIGTKSTFMLNLLSLKAALNLDAAYPMEVVVPAIENMQVLKLAELKPEFVYKNAILLRPQLRVGKLQYDAAGKNAEAAKASMYPSISAFANLNTAYSSAQSFIPKGDNITSVQPTPAFIEVAGVPYFVNSPVSRPERFIDATLFRQFGNNFRQAFGVSINVPIFNGGQARTNYNRALINQQNIMLQMQADSLALKQDIYNAYQNALNALAIYNSRKKAYETSNYSFNLAKQRYELNLLPVFDYINLQNNALRASIDQITARYDYIFRTMILQFYEGTGLKIIN